MQEIHTVNYCYVQSSLWRLNRLTCFWLEGLTDSHKGLFVCSWHSALPIHHNSPWGGDLRVAIHSTWCSLWSPPWTADILILLYLLKWHLSRICRHLIKMCEVQTIPGVTRQCIACCLEIAEQQLNSIVSSHAQQLRDCKTNAQIHLLRSICRCSGWEWMGYSLKLDLNAWMCHQYASNV